MSRWNQGSGAIEQMLAVGDLERVPASRQQARHLVDQAETHLRSARAIAGTDPVGAYQLAYDAARKALTAPLEAQGLRPTSRGGHVAVYEAARAQFDPPMGRIIRPFNVLRRRRNENQYPADQADATNSEETGEALEDADAIVDLGRRVIDELEPF